MSHGVRHQFRGEQRQSDSSVDVDENWFLSCEIDTRSVRNLV
jgi:hypothetical protein